MRKYIPKYRKTYCKESKHATLLGDNFCSLFAHVTRKDDGGDSPILLREKNHRMVNIFSLRKVVKEQEFSLFRTNSEYHEVTANSDEEGCFELSRLSFCVTANSFKSTI